jgi:hypothetical protein
MIHAENQVRNFHVLKTTAAVKSAEVNGTKKLYFEDAHGVFSDKIDVKNIRYVTKVTPTAYKTKKWEIVLPTANVAAGNDLIVNFNFKNMLGFGEKDCYTKFAVAHMVSGDTAQTVLQKLAANISKNFKYELANPFSEIDSTSDIASTTGGYKLTIKEKDFTVTDADLLLGNMPYHMDVTITPEVIVHTSANGVTTTSSVALEIPKAIDNVNKGNRFLLADMERFFLKNRASLYGYNGFPNVTPTQPIISASHDTDSVVEIWYYYQDKGVSSYNSEKQMTLYLQGGNATDLETAIKAIVDPYTFPEEE